MIPFEAEIFTCRQARESWPTHPSACPCSDETPLAPLATLQRGFGRTDAAGPAAHRKGYAATRFFAPTRKVGRSYG